MRHKARESLIKRDVRVQEKQRQRERERNSKPDRVNEFTLTAHIYILNSLATCGAFGTIMNHAMSCFSTIKNHYCYMLYSKTSIKLIFMGVFVCSNACVSVCVYT